LGLPGQRRSKVFNSNLARWPNYRHTPGGIEILLENRRGRRIDNPDGWVEEGSGIFIPQLGAAMKIVDVAQQLIDQDRSRVEKAIPVTFTGLRTGDKMSEEFLSEEETKEPTIDMRLFRVINNKVPNDRFHLHIDELFNSAGAARPRFHDRNALQNRFYLQANEITRSRSGAVFRLAS
jgi:hypothetical protein